MPKSKEYIESDSDVSSDSEPKQKKQKKEKKVKEKAVPKSPPKSRKDDSKPAAKSEASSESFKGDDGTTMYPLSKARNVSVSEFRGNAYVNIREYYEKDGKTLPGKKGISLNREQWQKLKSYIDDIDSELSKV